MARQIHLALVEDRPAVRELLLERLGFFEDIRVVFAAASAEAFFAQLARPEQLQPEVVLMDIELPGIDGVAATAQLKADHPEIDVIMLTVFEDEDRIFAAVQAGATGYLLKDATAEQIVGAVREVAEGGAPVSAMVAKKLMAFIRGDERELAQALTRREREVLHLIVDGVKEETIAEQLFISPHTVRGHVKNLYRKLQVHSRAEIVRVAYEKRLIR